jgi:hypothetical protein
MAEINEREISAPDGSSTGSGATSEARQRAEAAAGQASAAATGVKEHAAQAASEVKEQAGEELAAVRDEARHEARTLAQEARDRIEGQVEGTTRHLASTIADAGRELRAMAERSDRADSPVTEVVRQLADRTESVANRLESGGYRGVVDDVTRLGRNRPGLFLVAVGAAGFLVGRVLRNADTSSVKQAVQGAGGNGHRSSPDGGGSSDGPADMRPERVAEPVVVGARTDRLVVEAPLETETYAPPLEGPAGGRV